MLNENGQTPQKKDQPPTVNPVIDDKWPEAIRNLIKHENELISNRVGWMLTFQGFLFTALAFGWDKGAGQRVSLLTLLCWCGVGQAVLSFLALVQADKAISKLLKEWNKFFNKTSEVNRDSIAPPWGWVDVPVKEHLWPRRWITAPWVLLPVVLIVGWTLIYLLYDYPRSAPLTDQW